MITETRPVPCGNPRVMATVAYHEHELRCASCLQVLLDAANLQVDEARKALEIISEFDARDFAQFGAQALMDAVAVAKIGLSKMKPTEKPKCECPHHSFKPDMQGCLCCGQGMGQGVEKQKDVIDNGPSGITDTISFSAKPLSDLGLDVATYEAAKKEQAEGKRVPIEEVIKGLHGNAQCDQRQCSCHFPPGTDLTATGKRKCEHSWVLNDATDTHCDWCGEYR